MHDNLAESALTPSSITPIICRKRHSLWTPNADCSLSTTPVGTSYNRHLLSRTGLFSTSISPEGSIGERARLPANSGKQIEPCVIASFQAAESMGFKGEFSKWEELLRLGG